MQTASDIDSIHDLIAYAARQRAKMLYPSSSYEWSDKGTNPADLSKQELIAEGVLIWSRIMDNQGQMASKALMARWGERDEQNRAVDKLGAHVFRQSQLSRWNATDAVWFWSLGRPRTIYKDGKNIPRDCQWWADHEGKPYSWVYRQWGIGKDGNGRGISKTSVGYILDQLYQRAVDQAEINLRGLV